MLTFDSSRMTQDAAGNQLGRPLPHACLTHDGRTVDSTGAFMVGELERLDQKLHAPLVDVTWGRDIDLREDVTIADDVSSYTISTFGAPGSLGTGNSIGNGKAWIGRNTNQIAGVDLDLAKITHPLTTWGRELKYSIMELESAAKLGRPIDQQKFEGLQISHQMEVDEQVYIGDTTLQCTGLVNNDTSRTGGVITAQNVAASPVTGSTLWSMKTPDEILADVSEALSTTWANSAWAVMPSRILLPPAQYGLVCTQKISQAGTFSTLKYLIENNLLVGNGGQVKLEVLPLKWCIGSAVGGTTGILGTGDRMVIYTKDPTRVRFPMTMLQRTPVQYDSVFHKTTYFCKLGQVETVYPQCISYRDGI
jgi:hypothetical protein